MNLTCAIPKGRPMKDLLPCFEALGGDGLDDASRKLTVYDGGLDLTYFLSKSMDVPTYVEHGAADIGIAGKDVLLEADRDVVELLDLGLSACELVFAVPDDSDVYDISDLNFHSRVATKYIHVAQRFFNKHAIQVEMIYLNGSVELAPIVDLADAVVDVTQTGTTLRENGLRVVCSVAESSLRLIANPISYKVSFDRIMDLTDRLRSVVETKRG